MITTRKSTAKGNARAASANSRTALAVRRKAGAKPTGKMHRPRQAKKLKPGRDSQGGKGFRPESSAQASAGSRRANKGEELRALLKRSKGASLAELMTASGWQAHSVRGFLSGTIKKRMGLQLESARGAGGVRRYRLGS